MTHVTPFTSLIERDASGAAPRAFLIWPAGTVETEIGTFEFSARSAELLVADQAARDVLYPFDVDHLSLRADVPEHARRAVGWHRIEIRDGALWAVDCEWTPAIREALESKPPAYRYYSPVFEFDKETREITRYIGCALTNAPATHSATDLAAASMADRTAFFAARPDLSPELVEALKGASLEQVKRVVGALDARAAQRQQGRASINVDSAAAAAASASRGSSQGERPNPELDVRMGVVKPQLGVTFEAATGVQAFGVRVEQAQRGNEQRVAARVPSGASTSDELAQQRDELDRRMRVGAYAPGGARGSTFDGIAQSFGVPTRGAR